ncbi:histidine phosphatase family protein [Paenibacillus xerothermodurans]|uniref:histidine phosphatase family protein n=1 Tax=Paenibacillus xerothermodurans TaxID=1977292 RepID=UPI00311F4D04
MIDWLRGFYQARIILIGKICFVRHLTFEDLDICYEGGESSNTAMSRAIRAVMEVLNGENKNVVLVSHGNLISLLLKHSPYWI